MSESAQERESAFIATPIDNLIAVFHDIDDLNTSVDELKQAGFAEAALRSFIGEEGIRDMDFDGSSNGPAAELLRYLQRIGPDRTYLERYESFMKDGDSLLMVYAPEKGKRDTAADILRKHSAHRVTYFGTLMIEEV